MVNLLSQIPQFLFKKLYVEARVTETTAQRPYAVDDRIGITIPLPIFGRRYIKSLRAASFVVTITAARVVEITENDSGSAIAVAESVIQIMIKYQKE